MAGGNIPSGAALLTAGGHALRRRVEAQRRENGRRVFCPHCDLTVLPENLARHLTVVHDEQVAP